MPKFVSNRPKTPILKGEINKIFHVSPNLEERGMTIVVGEYGLNSWLVCRNWENLLARFCHNFPICRDNSCLVCVCMMVSITYIVLSSSG